MRRWPFRSTSTAGMCVARESFTTTRLSLEVQGLWFRLTCLCLSGTTHDKGSGGVWTLHTSHPPALGVMSIVPDCFGTDPVANHPTTFPNWKCIVMRLSPYRRAQKL